MPSHHVTKPGYLDPEQVLCTQSLPPPVPERAIWSLEPDGLTVKCTQLRAVPFQTVLPSIVESISLQRPLRRTGLSRLRDTVVHMTVLFACRIPSPQPLNYGA